MTNEQDVYLEIRSQLNNPTLSSNYQNFLEKYCNWEDGKSTQRAMSFILDGGYQTQELSFNPEELKVSEDIVIWSDVVGYEKYHIVKNIIADDSTIRISKKATLFDPIQQEIAGEPCYFVQHDSYEGWISQSDYDLLKQ